MSIEICAAQDADRRVRRKFRIANRVAKNQNKLAYLLAKVRGKAPYEHYKADIKHLCSSIRKGLTNLGKHKDAGEYKLYKVLNAAGLTHLVTNMNQIKASK